jgi:exosortase D (VPLPA-CTERM-specific)
VKDSACVPKPVPVSGWLRFLLLGGALAVLYRPVFAFLYHQWQQDDFTYGFFIPFVVLYLLWEKRRELSLEPSCPDWAGLVPVLAGLALFWLGELSGEFTLLFLSLWCVVAGVCRMQLGRKKLRLVGFPLVFSLAMFPPPNMLNQLLSLKLKLISSRLGVELLHLYGMSAYREGNVIDVGFAKLQVVDACSGLRYLLPLVIMAVLLAFFFRAPLWKKAVLVASAVPLSVATNSLRIASVGVLYQYMGPKAAEGFFHDFSGWIIFMFCLALLLGEMWLLGRVGGLPKEGAAASAGEASPAPAGCAGTFTRGRAGGVAQFAVVALLLAGTAALAYGMEFREKVPVKKPLELFPLEVGEWRGQRGVIEPDVLAQLKLTSYAVIDFTDPRGRQVNLYVAYNDSQRKGEATHSPGTCLPSSGWAFDEAGTAGVPIQQGRGGEMQVSRAVMQKNDQRKLTYYWFPQRGRVLTNLYQIKLYNFWDALTRKRTDGALVRLITPVYAGEATPETEARLQAFCRQMVPVLGEYIPE